MIWINALGRRRRDRARVTCYCLISVKAATPVETAADAYRGVEFALEERHPMDDRPPVDELGLTVREAAARLEIYGPNALPQPAAPSFAVVFLRQFLSPLIYILLAAALVSAALSDLKDAAFIGAVLLLNGIIGGIQEYSASQSTTALRNLESPRATVLRDGERQEIDARELVPGDVVLLEAGSRVAADLRLDRTEGLRCDEALLTGESRPVPKEAGADAAAVSAAFAGTLVVRGRGRGVVTATGAATKLGRIAGAITGRSISQPPLMIRMQRFSRTIALSVGVAVALLVGVGFLRGMGLNTLFLMAVGLAVSAIPEGLPVAISVALAVGMRRMAKAHVIVRNMPAIEALGSCTIIATDKTGTLTLNELNVTEVLLPDGTKVAFDAGPELDALRIHSPDLDEASARARANALLRAAALPNEARLTRGEDGWKAAGDTVDVALLAAARKGGIVHEELADAHPLIARIPYEPDLKYAASFHHGEKRVRIFVKGAAETLVAMADRMDCSGAPVPIDRPVLLSQKDALAASGLRVLAFAEGEIAIEPDGTYGHRNLTRLVFLGLAGMQDPLRPEVPAAVRACAAAGLEVAMVTGDDPRTARAIADRGGPCLRRRPGCHRRRHPPGRSGRCAGARRAHPQGAHLCPRRSNPEARDRAVARPQRPLRRRYRRRRKRRTGSEAR